MLENENKECSLVNFQSTGFTVPGWVSTQTVAETGNTFQAKVKVLLVNLH